MKSKKRQHIIFFSVCAGICLAYIIIRAQAPPPDEEDYGPPSVSEEVKARDEAADHAQTQVRIQQMAATENEKNKRELATVKTAENRSMLQLQLDSAWTTVINTNWQRYLELHKQATNSPSVHVPCTLCDGTGDMRFCVMCDGKGKCPTCKGTGHTVTGEYCSTCVGKGKCYLCLGKGRMPCPFCDDGTIYPNSRPPSKMLPTNWSN